MNIVELLARQTADRPDAPAIVDAAKSVTFAQLDRESRRLARALEADGLQPGDVVLVFCPMSAPLYVTLLAIFRLGLVAMFVDPSAGRRHLERSCEMCPPRAFIGTPRAHLLRLTSPAIRQIPVHRFVEPLLGRRHRLDQLAVSNHPSTGETPALVTFTSGSTGAPKAAMRTHGFLLAQHHALAQTLQFEPGTVDLTTLPIFVLANLASGVTSLLPDADMRFPGRADPAPILRQIRSHRPTRTVASPAFLSRLASDCLNRGARLDGMTHVFTGGGPVSPRVLDLLADAAPTARICGVYGSTEAEPIAVVEHTELGLDERSATSRGKGLLAGRTAVGVDVRVIRERWNRPLNAMTVSEFHHLQTAAGHAGEIVVSGDHVLPGYVGGCGDRESKFSVDGRRWHRTGDAGYFDARGRLWLLGRCAAAIDDAAGRLYPFSVEAAAEEHPAVARAAVFADRGRRVLAVQSESSGDRLKAALEADLAWASIDEVRFQTIPLDARHNAKVDYERLSNINRRSGTQEQTILGWLAATLGKQTTS